jgi:two-component system chemotaxis response regulator CheB
VVIGASAGGLQALRQLVARLPDDLPASVLVTVHLAPNAPSRLPAILSDIGSLPAVAAADGQRMTPGTIYAAVPDRHLLISENDSLRLSPGPRENRVRPAVDKLFRSAARWAGPRAIGVVLSGTLDDGAAGLATIARRGGLALVQSPDEARFSGMPRAALSAVPEANALPLSQLAKVITEAVGQQVTPSSEGLDDDLRWETDMAERGLSTAEQAGRPVALGCPECSGGMNVVPNGNSVHYVCHTGHSYSPQTLIAARDEGIEAALWTALSALQEKSTVLRGLAERAGGSGDQDQRRRHETAAARAEHAADLLREQILNDKASWIDA